MHKITPYRLPMRRIAVLLLAAAVTTGVLGACGPVTPHATISTSIFEGFDVVSYVPEHPVGMAYVFHGSYGSADFATKVETVDTLNELIDRGYGFIATESTLRTGNKRWNVFDPSLTTNVDLARLVRLHDHFVDTTAITADTPLVGIGMSNGARFVSLWGQEWADAGYPVRAIAMYMGTIAPPVETTGGLSVPTVFVTAENDSTSPPWPIAVDQASTAAQGTPSELIVAREQALSAARFVRIPGVDSAEATAIFDAFVATGAWDTDGTRLVPVADAASSAAAASLPASVAPVRSEIANQVALVLAEHQMRGDVRVPVAEFVGQFV